MKLKNKKLGINIRYWRKRKGYSQEDLAYKSKLKLSNVSKIEGGFSKNPTLETLISLANALTKGSIDKLLK